MILGDGCVIQARKTTSCTGETSPGVSATGLAFKIRRQELEYAKVASKRLGELKYYRTRGT